VVADRVLVPNDHELLFVLEELRNVLAKQGEWWIRDDDVCLLKEFNGLVAPEVPVALEVLDADALGIRNHGIAELTFVFEIDGLFGVVLAEQVAVLVLVARRDELLEAELLEVVRKVVEEVADPWIVAVAVHLLPLEVRRVVLELLLDVGELRVELVFLRRF